jgi:hypothetical protein
MRRLLIKGSCALTLLCASVVLGQPTTETDSVYVATATAQSEADEYTRYELLNPASGSFKITYEVTATTPGARFFYNPIRKGSLASDEHVYDAASGAELKVDVVRGIEARKDALMPDADLETSYIRVTLARPVPERGQARLIVVKTYQDPKSYYAEGKAIVFNRSLGVKRNKVVLPAGFSVVELSVPSQILTESDGRISVSFLNAGGGDAPLIIRAVNDAPVGAAARPTPSTARKSWESPFEGPTEEERLSELAHESREIVYFLQQPSSHAFKLYHDFTETRPGVNGYANVVRAGSVASDPSAIDLDTGESLKAQEMSGAELAKSRINVGESVAPDARVIVIPFPAVRQGQTIRLRIAETYTAPVSYRLDGDDLVFDRSLGRPRNAIVLPSGWYCSFSAEPATVSQLPDGRVRLDYWNNRPEPVDVLLKARRRISPP